MNCVFPVLSERPFDDIQAWIESIACRTLVDSSAEVERTTVSIKLGVVGIEMSSKAKRLDQLDDIGCVKDIQDWS